jgi:hypothetical protein
MLGPDPRNALAGNENYLFTRADNGNYLFTRAGNENYLFTRSGNENYLPIHLRPPALRKPSGQTHLYPPTKFLQT